jgi:hypothetical protein
MQKWVRKKLIHAIIYTIHLVTQQVPNVYKFLHVNTRNRKPANKSPPLTISAFYFVIERNYIEFNETVAVLRFVCRGLREYIESSMRLAFKTPNTLQYYVDTLGFNYNDAATYATIMDNREGLGWIYGINPRCIDMDKYLTLANSTNSQSVAHWIRSIRVFPTTLENTDNIPLYVTRIRTNNVVPYMVIVFFVVLIASVFALIILNMT